MLVGGNSISISLVDCATIRNSVHEEEDGTYSRPKQESKFKLRLNLSLQCNIRAKSDCRQNNSEKNLLPKDSEKGVT